MKRNSFTDYYANGIKYLDEILKPIIDEILKGYPICMYTLPLWGSTRLTDYLYYRLKKHKTVNVQYIQRPQIDYEELERRICKDKMNIFIVKRFWEQSNEFHRIFIDFIERNENTVNSVIVLTPQFIKKITRHFPNHTRLFDSIYYLKLLSYKHFEAIIELRTKVDNENVPKSLFPKIYEFTQGHGALTKYICKYYYKYQNIDVKNLLEYPPIKICLDALATSINELNTNQLEEFGIEINNKKYNIAILNYFNIENTTLSLSPNQKKLLKIFLEKENKLVSMNEIEEIISQNDDFSIWGTYKSISRFKSAISSKYLLQNVRKKGYILRKIK